MVFTQYSYNTQRISMDDEECVFDLACLIWLCYYFVFIFHSIWRTMRVSHRRDQWRFLRLVPTPRKKPTWTGEWRMIWIYCPRIEQF